MTVDNKLDLILGKVTDLQDDVTALRKDVAELRTDVTELQAGQEALRKDVAELRTDVTELQAGQEALQKDVTDIKRTVAKNYYKTLEFYGNQKESNIIVFDNLARMQGRLEIYANQLARNTFEISHYK